MRLYHCSATCSARNLVSYDTRLFWVDYPYYILYIYPSNTSKLHIRKYVKWLHDNDYVTRAGIIQHMYYLGIKYKKPFVVYALRDDKYVLADDYHHFVK